MAESFVQVAPDSTGKQLRTETSVQGGNTVHQEVMTLADAAGNLVGSTGAAGSANAIQTALYDSAGTAFQRASATNMSAAVSGAQAQIITWPGCWSAFSNPAAGTAASATRAAGGAGVRHVLTGLTITVSATTALAGITTITFNLRDGASGAGTILAAWSFNLPASTVAATTIVQLAGLTIFGSANTAMTLEGSAAVGNLMESVVITGFDVQ